MHRTSQPALAFDQLDVDGSILLDFEIRPGEIVCIGDCDRSLAQRVLEIVCGRATPRGGDVRLDDLPAACWAPADLHQRLRVLKPQVCHFVGGPFGSAAGAHPRLAGLLRTLPRGIRCVVIDSLLDGLPLTAKRDEMDALREFVQARQAAALVFCEDPSIHEFTRARLKTVSRAAVNAPR